MTIEIKRRRDLPKLITTDEPIGIELGVARGNYSKDIINRYNFKKFYMIDWWKNSNHVQSYLKLIEFTTAIKKQNEGTQICVLRGAFSEFVNFFEDNYFDFIYVDGIADNGQLEGQTIRDWLPKVKPNGIICGHDYCNDYPKTKHYVNLVGEENNFNVNVVCLNDNHPSWYYTKK